MKNSIKGALIFGAIVLLSFLVGSYILAAAFFGTLTLVGLIVLVESMPFLKWIAVRSSKLLDILIFVFTIMATAQYGLNIAASLTIAGLGYTLVYAPYLREQRIEKKNRPKPIGNYKSKFDAR